MLFALRTPERLQAALNRGARSFSPALRTQPKYASYSQSSPAWGEAGRRRARGCSRSSWDANLREKVEVCGIETEGTSGALASRVSPAFDGVGCSPSQSQGTRLKNSDHRFGVVPHRQWRDPPHR